MGEITALLRELGADDGPLGLDQLDTVGFSALAEAGITLVDSTPITMAARDIKTPQEIELIKVNGAIGDAMSATSSAPSARASVSTSCWRR